jgi:hypothetical protein
MPTLLAVLLHRRKSARAGAAHSTAITMAIAARSCNCGRNDRGERVSLDTFMQSEQLKRRESA